MEQMLFNFGKKIEQDVNGTEEEKQSPTPAVDEKQPTAETKEKQEVSVNTSYKNFYPTKYILQNLLFSNVDIPIVVKEEEKESGVIEPLSHGTIRKLISIITDEFYDYKNKADEIEKKIDDLLLFADTGTKDNDMWQWILHEKLTKIHEEYKKNNDEIALREATEELEKFWQDFYEMQVYTIEETNDIRSRPEYWTEKIINKTLDDCKTESPYIYKADVFDAIKLLQFSLKDGMDKIEENTEKTNKCLTTIVNKINPHTTSRETDFYINVMTLMPFFLACSNKESKIGFARNEIKNLENNFLKALEYREKEEKKKEEQNKTASQQEEQEPKITEKTGRGR